MNYTDLELAVRAGAATDVAALVRTGWLTRIAEGQSSLRAVQHPLGFTCFPVLRDGTHGVCVHVWGSGRPPARLTTSPFHCHSWDLLSHILYGTVGNQRVEVTDGHTYRLFEARTTPTRDEIVPTAATVDAKAFTPEFWSAGEHYDLSAGDFHASTLPDVSPAATVVLGLHRPDRQDLTLGSLDTPTHSITRRLYTGAETARIAQRLLDRLVQVERPSVRVLTGAFSG